ncbi:transcription elongation factor GreA [Sulfuricurvum sp.]|uniref:transcription elongation factor GreA n=1 Tax=Sulfuricurvum sp. TaxID=2025608 RepID=UPI00199DCF98|nr:transcription elongation factor GreA [Sulfuricurvum sp.]MBD3799353.1 transcription elongation factor GreA [Campylobacterota bacterium]MBD3806630.1 transcription elongation factor GreA [Sulfuricurvum sp.]
MHVEPMTPQGYDELLREFKFLKDVEKPRVNEEKQRAAELGDRSENAEYHAAKEKLRHIDKRLFYLNSMIEKAQIIDPATLDHSRVHFGATVEICDVVTDEEFCYTICGTLESEPDNGLISVHSPLARALLGKEEGDEVSVSLPAGRKSYEVVSIRYEDLFGLKKNIRTEKEYGFK